MKNRIWKIKLDELDFLYTSNLNFSGYTGSKSQAQTSQKVKFLRLDFSNSIFQKLSAVRLQRQIQTRLKINFLQLDFSNSIFQKWSAVKVKKIAWIRSHHLQWKFKLWEAKVQRQNIAGCFDKRLNTKSLLAMPRNILPLHLKQTFPPIVWGFTEGEVDEIESRLAFKLFSTLDCNSPRRDKSSFP